MLLINKKTIDNIENDALIMIKTDFDNYSLVSEKAKSNKRIKEIVD